MCDSDLKHRIFAETLRMRATRGGRASRTESWQSVTIDAFSGDRQSSSPSGSYRGLIFRFGFGLVFCMISVLAGSAVMFAQEPILPPTPPNPLDISDFVSGGPDIWTSPEGFNSTLQIMLLLTVLSLAPAIVLMTTSFVRIVVVLSLLRQALGTQQLPPSQVIASMSLFLTLLVMTPVWKQVYEEAIVPYTSSSNSISFENAWDTGVQPVRRFMASQIDAAGNGDDIRLFYRHLPQELPEPQHYGDVPLQVLLPAFMLSELKTAFLIGFQIYLPFLILDIVIASVTISMGMLMLPPVVISLPFKLMLFVLVDGWHLVVGMLLESFAPIS